jgi:hypothetical protein
VSTASTMGPFILAELDAVAVLDDTAAQEQGVV